MSAADFQDRRLRTQTRLNSGAVHAIGTEKTPAGFIDLAAARHCARIAASHYRHAGVELPQRLKEHLRVLESTPASSAAGTECEAAQASSTHDLIGTDQAAQILGCSTRYVCRIAADLDGRRVSGRWSFDKQLVVAYGVAKADRRQCD